MLKGWWGRGSKGTDSYFRAMVALDEVERGHFSLDTVRAQGRAFREGGLGPQRVCSRASPIVTTQPSQASANQNPYAAALSLSCIITVLSRTPAWWGVGHNLRMEFFGEGKAQGAMVGWGRLPMRAGSWD